MGALIEGPGLWPSLTGLENLRLLTALSGHRRERISEVLEVVGLATRAGDRYGEYSLGMKQRLGIAAALLGDPRLLILDEPTNGLDPAGIREMRELIANLARGDRTVLVSSHILSEVEQVCGWLIVIDRGALVYQGPTSGFVDGDDTRVVLSPEDGDDIDRVLAIVRSEGLNADREGSRVVIAANGHDPRILAAALNRSAMSAGIVLAELHARQPTLESHYLSIVEGGER